MAASRSLVAAAYGSDSDDDADADGGLPRASAAPAPAPNSRIQIRVHVPAPLHGHGHGDDDGDSRSLPQSSAAARPRGLPSLFDRLPAPKRPAPADDSLEHQHSHDAPQVRSLGQAAADAPQSGLSLTRPIARPSFARKSNPSAPSVAEAAPSPPPAPSAAPTRPEQTTPDADSPKKASQTEDFFTLDINTVISAEADPLITQSKPSLDTDSVDAEAVESNIEPVAGDYEAYAAAYLGYTPQDQEYVYENGQGSSSIPDIPPDIDPKELAKLGYRPQDGAINFKDINRREQLGNHYAHREEKEASLQGLSEDSSFAKLKSGIVVSQGMKRRHNIMSLVYEARARQESLQEQAANRRAMQRITRAKYGF